MITEKEQEKNTIEFWHSTFESYGFERDSFYGNSSRTWFSRGHFHVGFNAEDFRDKIYPSFDITYDESGYLVHVRTRLMLEGMSSSGKSFTYEAYGILLMDKMMSTVQSPDEFITVLDAISEPKRVPLAIGIDWASDLVSIFLQRSAAGTILQV